MGSGVETKVKGLKEKVYVTWGYLIGFFENHSGRSNA